MNAPDVIYQVARQFTVLRRRYISVRLATVACLAASIFLAAWIVTAIIDHRWEWESSWRRTMILSAVMATAVWAIWHLVALFRATRQRQFAGVVENSFEDFGQRIRTVLDTVSGRVVGPREMLTALGNQTLGRWESVSPSQMVPTRALCFAGVICLALASATLGLFGVGGDWRKALLRAVGSEVPYTTMEVAPGDTRVLEGSPVEVTLNLSGRADRDVTLRYREIRPQEEEEAGSEENAVAENSWIESDLLSDDEDPRQRAFSSQLGKARYPIEYQFVAGGKETQIHRIDIQPLIEVRRVEIHVQAPEYTGLQPRLFSSPELTVSERSEVTVTIELNHPLGEALLETGPKLAKLKPVEVQAGEDRALWTFTLPATRAIRWRFSGSGTDGTPMDPLVGRLGVRKDGAPTLRWREPSDEIQVHTLAELPLGVNITDDHGVSEAGIVFQLGSDEEYVLTEWSTELEAAMAQDAGEPLADKMPNKTRLLLKEILPLESFELTERDYIAYYAYAVDNRPWGQHRAESDVRYIDIRPLRQFYSEVDLPANPNNGAGRVIIRLAEIIRRERFVINRTRKLVRSGMEDLSQHLGTIDRLVENQSELADLTRFLAEFFISRGNDDVEALSRAEAVMLQASDSLAAGELDLALVQEQEALRSLAEARRMLEIALAKRLTPAQQRALRRLAEQLRQKLRRERPETERELADSLQRIAAQQRQLASQASQMMSQSMNQGSGGGGMPDPEQEPNKNNGNPNATEPADTPEAETPPSETPGESEKANNDSDTESSDAESDEPENQEGDEAAESEDENPEGDADAEGESDGGGESGEEEPTDPKEEMFERQIDLLERLEAIQEQLGDRLNESNLLSERMTSVQEAMDSLATQAREGDFENVARSGVSTSDLLEELGIQLAGLAADEPITRVSSIRDMTNGLASMEHQLSEAVRKELEGRGGAASESDEEEPEAFEDSIQRLAQQMQARSETLSEAFEMQADIGDIEMSEVNDQLRGFAEGNEIESKLDETESAAESLEEKPEAIDEDTSPEALQRAVEYAEAARELDRLYQQLVTPRLARLRRMENNASNLARQMQNGGSSGQNNQRRQDTETRAQMAGVRQLEKELEAEGLEELAEMLRRGGGGGEDEQKEEMQRASGGSDPDVFRRQDKQSDGGVALQESSGIAERVRLVARELRERIQQVILMEIAVDRNTPVPSMYRRAVDGYFHTLASDGDAVEMEAATTAPEESL